MTADFAKGGEQVANNVLLLPIKYVIISWPYLLTQYTQLPQQHRLQVLLNFLQIHLPPGLTINRRTQCHIQHDTIDTGFKQKFN